MRSTSVFLLILQLVNFACLVSMHQIPQQWLPGSISIVGALLQEKEIRNMYQCENLCKATSPCQAVSYSVRTRKCSLFREVPAKDNISPSISDIRISDIRNLPEGACKQRCDSGYACVQNGDEFTCNLAGVSCGPHPILQHADVTSTTVTYNSIGTYACHTGYRSEKSNPTTRCTEDGSWSLPSGSCTLVSCGKPDDLPNAGVDYAATTYGSTATYTCDVGYVFEGGDSKVICTAVGDWSVLAGSCKLISCGRPPVLPHADVKVKAVTYNSIVIYACHIGYRSEGSSLTTRCTEDGSWSRLPGSCALISCGHPLDISNGRVDYPATTYGSTATYTCNEDFFFEGEEPQRSCIAAGVWSPLSGSCKDQYRGCFKDTQDRMLKHGPVTSSRMTKELCLETCKQQNKKYAGLQNHSQCFCGDSWNSAKHPKVRDSLCTQRCSGDSAQICGGVWLQTVYRVA